MKQSSQSALGMYVFIFLVQKLVEVSISIVFMGEFKSALHKVGRTRGKFLLTSSLDGLNMVMGCPLTFA